MRAAHGGVGARWGERMGSTRWMWRALLVGSVIATTLVVVDPLGTHDSAERANASQLEPDPCVGDELIAFAPTEPAADEELLVTVTSSRQHRGVWLSGTERAVLVRENPGQLGWG